MKRSLRAVLAFCPLLAALAAGVARAESTYDMATFTCQDWLDASDDERDLMLVWLRGYLGGRVSSSLYKPDATRADGPRFEAYCRAHLNIGVISAMGQLPP